MPLVFTIPIGTTGNANAQIAQGETGSNQLVFTSDGIEYLNLTGYSLKMTIGFPTPVSLTTGNGGITIINAALGQAQINIADTSSETYPVGTFPYDLFTISGGGVSTRWMSGFFTVLQSQTPIP